MVNMLMLSVLLLLIMLLRLATPFVYAAEIIYTHIKITSKVNESFILEARQFAEQKTTLLHEVDK